MFRMNNLIMKEIVRHAISSSIVEKMKGLRLVVVQHYLIPHIFLIPFSRFRCKSNQGLYFHYMQVFAKLQSNTMNFSYQTRTTVSYFYLN